MNVGQIRELLSKGGFSLESLAAEPGVQDLIKLYSTGQIPGLSQGGGGDKAEKKGEDEGDAMMMMIGDDEVLFEEAAVGKQQSDGKKEEKTEGEEADFPFMGLGEKAGCEAKKAWREEVASLKAEVDSLRNEKAAAVKRAERLKAMLDTTTKELEEACKKPSCVDGVIIVQSVLASMEGGANVEKRAVGGVYRSMLEIKSAYDHLSKAAMPAHLKTWFETTLRTKAAVIIQKIRSVLDTV